eukprot:3647287-Pleurochrysis_carterae.AAC.1
MLKYAVSKSDHATPRNDATNRTRAQMGMLIEAVTIESAVEGLNSFMPTADKCDCFGPCSRPLARAAAKGTCALLDETV